MIRITDFYRLGARNETVKKIFAYLKSDARMLCGSYKILSMSIWGMPALIIIFEAALNAFLLAIAVAFFAITADIPAAFLTISSK